LEDGGKNKERKCLGTSILKGFDVGGH